MPATPPPRTQPPGEWPSTTTGLRTTQNTVAATRTVRQPKSGTAGEQSHTRYAPLQRPPTSQQRSGGGKKGRSPASTPPSPRRCPWPPQQRRPAAVTPPAARRTTTRCHCDGTEGRRRERAAEESGGETLCAAGQCRDVDERGEDIGTTAAWVSHCTSQQPCGGEITAVRSGFEAFDGKKSHQKNQRREDNVMRAFFYA